MSAVRIGVIIGSTRPGRVGDQVARWVIEQSSARHDAEFELVDLADFALPHLDESAPAALGQYANDHTKAWAAKVDSFDGYIFVTRGALRAMTEGRVTEDWARHHHGAWADDMLGQSPVVHGAETSAPKPERRNGAGA